MKDIIKKVIPLILTGSKDWSMWVIPNDKFRELANLFRLTINHAYSRKDWIEFERSVDNYLGELISKNSNLFSIYGIETHQTFLNLHTKYVNTYNGLAIFGGMYAYEDENL